MGIEVVIGKAYGSDDRRWQPSYQNEFKPVRLHCSVVLLEKKYRKETRQAVSRFLFVERAQSAGLRVPLLDLQSIRS